MAKDSTEIAMTNDVQVIREILFGEHLKTLLTRIESLEAKVSELRSDLEAETDAREQQGRTGQEKVEKVRSKISADLREVHRDLSQRIESEFAAHRNQHDDLISELAGALMRFHQVNDRTKETQK